MYILLTYDEGGVGGPPLQGRRKKKSKGGGEVLFVSAPFRSVIFYRPPPKYIFRFNPPPFPEAEGGGVISAAYTSPPLSCAPAFLKNLGLYPRFFCGIICIYDTLQYRVGGGDDAPFPKKMLDYLYILMPPPPLQGRTKKKSKGGGSIVRKCAFLF